MQDSIQISRRAADGLRAGHLWVYRSELGEANLDVMPGSLVAIVDSVGRPLGTALYSSASQIALRLVSAHTGITRGVYLADLRIRVQAALERRKEIAPLGAETGAASDAQRLIFSEADALPGIIADRYADLVIVQLLTQGTAQDDVRAVLIDAFKEHFAPGKEPLTIWERPDPRIRELEQLAPPPEGPLFTRASEDSSSQRFSSSSRSVLLSSRSAAEGSAFPPEPQNASASTRTTFTLNGLHFSYDAAAGQKTGAFLDQRLNYAAAAAWIRRSGHTGHALDVCTYQGGFALHLAQVCTRVTGVDQSRSALETADRNLTLNEGLRAEVDWIEADAFEFLRALDEASREDTSFARPRRGMGNSGMPAGLPKRFDAIVLDPPAFAKSKRATEGALRGYKEMNLRAMRLLVPGGTLVTCSCSHHVSLEAFVSALTEAAADAGRRVQLLETRAAAPDHPEVLTLPETRYLKCLICRIE